MPLSREETAKLLVKRANLAGWIEDARTRLPERDFLRASVGHRLCLMAVEEDLRHQGVPLDD